jgi:large subunit ribosomal protein L24
MHVKTGDEVLIVAGKDKGKRGKIKQSLPKDGRVVVEGLNMIKRHMKQRGPGKPGGIIDMEAPLQASNVMLICPQCGKAARTGRRFLEETDNKGRARKVRYCKVCDKAVDE